MEEKENKHQENLALNSLNQEPHLCFSFVRFALINETANGIKYRAMIMCFFSRGKQLGWNEYHHR